MGKILEHNEDGWPTKADSVQEMNEAVEQAEIRAKADELLEDITLPGYDDSEDGTDEFAAATGPIKVVYPYYTRNMTDKDAQSIAEDYVLVWIREQSFEHKGPSLEELEISWTKRVDIPNLSTDLYLITIIFPAKYRKLIMSLSQEMEADIGAEVDE